MKTAAVAFILSMLCGTLLTPLVRTMAYRMGALDHALSSRKIHGRPIPRLGGIAIVFAFYAPLVGLMLFRTGVGELFLAEHRAAIGLFVGGIAIALLGLYDDLRGAGAGRKFLVQFAVAGLMFALGFRIDYIGNPFGEPIALGWASLPLTMLWFTGVINAVNLIDGLDGLAGGVALVAVLTTFIISIQRGHPLMLLFSSALAGAILGFLFYNFNPASIFMGDTGSMFLGFVLAASAMLTNQKASTTVAVLIPVIVLGLPIMDTLLAMGRRALRGRPLFQADRDHIHHRLLALGLSHRQAVLVLYGFCILLAGAGVLLTYTNSNGSILLLLAVAVVAFVALRSLGYMRLDRVYETAAERRRNRALRTAVRPLCRRLREVRTLEDIWAVARDAIGVFGASGVVVRLAAAPGSEGTPAGFSHGVNDLRTDSSSLRAQFLVPGGKTSERVLELFWSDGRREIDRDTEIAIDMLCEFMGDAFELLKTVPVAGRATPDIAPRA
jgi:UDP-GlcNAc:undecaprenyl-phosphate GlcNAc-1-phosphate transferase